MSSAFTTALSRSDDLHYRSGRVSGRPCPRPLPWRNVTRLETSFQSFPRILHAIRVEIASLSFVFVIFGPAMSPRLQARTMLNAERRSTGRPAGRGSRTSPRR